MNTIYTAVFDCPICKIALTDDYHCEMDASDIEDRTKSHLNWNVKEIHWRKHHRSCAVCGQYVEEKDLGSVDNDGRIKIHQDYLDDYQPVVRGDRWYQLTVHQACMSAKQRQQISD